MVAAASCERQKNRECIIYRIYLRCEQLAGMCVVCHCVDGNCDDLCSFRPNDLRHWYKFIHVESTQLLIPILFRGQILKSIKVKMWKRPKEVIRGSVASPELSVYTRVRLPFIRWRNDNPFYVQTVRSTAKLIFFELKFNYGSLLLLSQRVHNTDDWRT